MTTDKVRFTVWLDKRMVETLKKIGEKDDRTVGYLLRRAVEEFIERRTKRG